MTPLDPGLDAGGIYIGDIPFLTLGRPQDGYNLFGLKGESTDDFGLVYPGTYANWPQEYAGSGAQWQNWVGGAALVLLTLGNVAGSQLGQYGVWLSGLGLLALVAAFVLYLRRPKEQRQFEAAQKQKQAQAAPDTLTLMLEVGAGDHPPDSAAPYLLTRRRGDKAMRVEELPLPPSRRVYVTLVGLTPDEKKRLEQAVSRTLRRNSSGV